MALENNRSSDGDYSDEELDGDQDVSMRFFAVDKEVGCIIGRKGDNVKALRNESGARINISDSSNLERIVTVRGSASQVIKAIHLIGQKLEEDGQTSYLSEEGENVTFRLIVPNSYCGSLIGRNGANIKELRERTGAKILVANEMLPDSTEREVEISGGIDRVMDCIKKLAKIAIETKSRAPHIPYNPNHIGGSGAAFEPGYPAGRKTAIERSSNRTKFNGLSLDVQGAGHNEEFGNSFRSQEGFASRVKGSGLTTEELVIPNESVGIIIGKNGNKINEIRQNSGAQIKIVECEDGSDNRRFIISGPRGNVQSAVYLIQNVRSRRRALSNKQQ